METKTILIGGAVIAGAYLFYRSAAPGEDSAAQPVPQTAFFIPSSTPKYEGDSGFSAPLDAGYAGISDAIGGIGGDGGANAVLQQALSGNTEIQSKLIDSSQSIAGSGILAEVLTSSIGKLRNNQAAIIDYTDEGRIGSIFNQQVQTVQNTKQANRASIQDYKAQLAIYTKQLKQNQIAERRGQTLPFANLSAPKLPQLYQFFAPTLNASPA